LFTGVPWFGRSVIRSNHQLNYYQAQAILDGRSPPTREDDLNDVAETGNVRKDLEVVANFSRVMRNERNSAPWYVSFFYFRMGN
jgi:exosome complex exonuclease DIS3/RRP44/DIS3-like exonuclease 1